MSSVGGTQFELCGGYETLALWGARNVSYVGGTQHELCGGALPALYCEPGFSCVLCVSLTMVSKIREHAVVVDVSTTVHWRVT